MQATECTWTRIKSQLSTSYWVCDQDDREHVYKNGSKWIRARVVNGLARSSSEHKTKAEAMAS